MLNRYHPLALAALLGVGAFAMSVSGASAAAIPAVKQFAGGDVINGGNSLLVEVAYRCWSGRPCWDRHRHGNRYRYRYGRYNHYYGGYYYSNPWWLVSVPIVIGGSRYRGGGSSRHVAWCYDRYRSYNARTNTWVSYSGNVNQCISPYRY
jgi:BA14K-like protein